MTLYKPFNGILGTKFENYTRQTSKLQVFWFFLIPNSGGKLDYDL